MSDPDTLLAGEWAARYRDCGFNPIPSDGRHPRTKFAHLRTQPIPADWPSKWWASGVQVLTGYGGLVVLDIDGYDGLATWESLSLHRSVPPTWTVLSGGNDGDHFGMHLWFTTSAVQGSVSSRLLWGLWRSDESARPGWQKRAAIELHADRSQIAAPPSYHRRTGRRYAFAPGLGPAEIAPPAPLPDWIAAMPAFRRPEVPASPRVIPFRRPLCPVAGSYAFADVLDAIPDKRAVAESWGLRFASGPGEGWVKVHAFDREDRNPSACFYLPTGGYIDHATGEHFGFFKLAVALGAYSSPSDCCNDLGSRYLARESSAHAG